MTRLLRLFFIFFLFLFPLKTKKALSSVIYIAFKGAIVFLEYCGTLEKYVCHAAAPVPADEKVELFKQYLSEIFRDPVVLES